MIEGNQPPGIPPDEPKSSGADAIIDATNPYSASGKPRKRYRPRYGDWLQGDIPMKMGKL